MAYIAKTNGGNTVLEISELSLTEIPEADRVNWRTVIPIHTQVDNFTTIKTNTSFVVSEDGSVVNLIWNTVPSDPLLVKASLKAYAARVRWEKQQGGLVLADGTKIKTDDESQAKIHQAFSILKEGWVQTIDFKTSNGWVSVDLATMTFIAQSVANFIQGCFSSEKAIGAAIDDGTITTGSQITNWNWS